MNGIQNKKPHSIEKQFPGCLGRMVNLFDLTTGVAGNRLLTDKPHHDGSSLSRSQSDVARILSPTFAEQIEDKMIVSESSRTSSNMKSNGTPMKMLIDQEISKDVESKHKPPNVVAQLMGLDALPRQQPDLESQRSHSKGYSRRSLSHSGIQMEWQQDHGFLDKEMQYEVHQCQEQNEYKDVHAVWQKSQKTNHVRDKLSKKGRYYENVNEKKMALVRQKFMEAKRLATDEKLRQSKEFQNALEVLSSNKDLFLKFLQEPNSLFSQHLYNLQSLPPPRETKRITVLRPSKMVDNDKSVGSGRKGEKTINRPAQAGQVSGWDKNLPGYSPPFDDQKVDEYPAQPTRIVVLKPSPGKAHDIKALVSLPSSSPRILRAEYFYEESEDSEAQESREVAKEITRQVRENLMGHRRDETLLSSVFSNGYIGDESSFNKSENEYDVGNLSDSEVMSPASRHSWDYVSRFGSPYSSSFSRASYSPESSVCREAKKRLSERWAMIASNGSLQEQRYVRKSSSTLGEMLALSDRKKSVRPDEEVSNKEQEQEPRESTSCLTSNLNKVEGLDVSSPKSLLRSKSVPVSSTVYGARLNVEVSDPEAGKKNAPKELIVAKSVKSSLRGKVSSLFFSRNKKSSKEKCSTSQLKDEFRAAVEETTVSPVHSPGKMMNDASQLISGSVHEECLSRGLHGSASKNSPDTSMGQKQGIVSQEAGLSVAKLGGNVNENQDQPSPISVLEPPFEEDDNTTAEFTDNFKQDCSGKQVFGHCLTSNLIDKSPPIESIARTLSWDDSYAETATPYLLNPSRISSGAEEEEQNWLVLVQKLLSVAGFDGEVNANSIFARLHSPESPLDPLLRYKYANQNDKFPLHEAKRRQRRSNRKLVFDCVNAALVEITGCGSGKNTMGRPYSGVHSRLLEEKSCIVLDHVWTLMKEWFPSEVGCVWGGGEGGDRNSLVVERMVRKEVVGKGWVEQMKVELDNVEKEIEKKLLEELVEDAVVNMTGMV